MQRTINQDLKTNNQLKVSQIHKVLELQKNVHFCQLEDQEEVELKQRFLS